MFLTLSGMKILTANLLPLLKGYPDNEEIAYQAGKKLSILIGISVVVIVTIATFLTMPVNPKTNDVQRQVNLLRCSVVFQVCLFSTSMSFKQKRVFLLHIIFHSLRVCSLTIFKVCPISILAEWRSYSSFSEICYPSLLVRVSSKQKKLISM